MMEPNPLRKAATRPWAALLIASLVALPGCRKEEGVGGKSEIRGVVLRQDMTLSGHPIGDPYPYHEQRVYIVYGDHAYHDDDVRTGPDGGFVFRWLKKGDYTVYTFGECANCPGGSVAVSRSVHVGSNKEVVEVPTMIVENY